MTETNKLINEKNNAKLESDTNEKNIIYNYIDILFQEKNYQRTKLSFLLIIIAHILFKLVDQFEENYDFNHMCIEMDPIYMFDQRIELGRDILCRSENTTHFCYKSNIENYYSEKGVICKMKNFTLDPSKWNKYDGPIDPKTKGLPLLSKGFYDIKCDQLKPNITDVNEIYNFYFNSWNYELKNQSSQFEKLEELAPERTVLFVNRNQDSGNLFYGGIEFINTYALMSSFYLNPEDVQVVFLESTKLKEDPLFELYKELISRGAPPMHISELKKKYFISAGMNIPIIYDSPLLIYSRIPKCKTQSRLYDFINQNIKDNMDLRRFVDRISYDKDVFYYPKRVLSPNSRNYKKHVTIQWRKLLPKEITGKLRVMGNGPELAEKLAEKLPGNVLVRLVDLDRLPIRRQIMLMKKTTYFVADFESGGFLSMFTPTKCIVNEISHQKNINLIPLIASLSGHATYSDIIKAKVQMINGNEVIYYDTKEFVKVILTHMKKNNFNK